MMPFDLKNTGVTYQQLVAKVFKEQIRHNMKVYVDNMIVKSRQPNEHLLDLQETFDRLCAYDMKLNR